MKKIAILGITASLLASGMFSIPPVQVNGATTLNVLQVSTLTKSEFMAYVSKSIKINYLHDADSIEDWIVKDRIYLSNTQDHILLQEQSEELLKLIEDMRKDYVVINGAKVYGFKQVAYIDALVEAVNHRQSIISDIAFNNKMMLSVGGREYQILSKTSELEVGSFVNTVLSNWDMWEDIKCVPSEKELLEASEGVWTALTQYNVPYKTLHNLPIFISPYYLVGYLGFTAGYDFVGRDEEVVIATSLTATDPKNAAIDTTLHELGHVFMSDTVGKVGGDIETRLVQNMKNWCKLYVNYPETHNLPLNERVSLISESFAEHFRSYLQEKVNKNGTKIVPIKGVYSFIEEQLKTYNPHTQYATPKLALQGISVPNVEFNYGALLRFKTNTVNASISEWDLSQKPLTYTLLQKDESRNGAITLIGNEPLTTLNLDFDVEPGQYALLIYSSDGLLRFNEFGIAE